MTGADARAFEVHGHAARIVEAGPVQREVGGQPGPDKPELASGGKSAGQEDTPVGRQPATAECYLAWVVEPGAAHQDHGRNAAVQDPELALDDGLPTVQPPAYHAVVHDQ